MSRRSLLLVPLVMIAATVVTACQTCPSGQVCVVQTRATPAPSFTGTAWEASRADLDAYLGTLDFDSAHTVAQATYLPGTGTPPLLGPLARVQAEIGAGRGDPAAAVSGRIIGRIHMSAEYAPLGLVAGVSYVWLDSIPSGRRLVLFDSLLTSVVAFPVTVDVNADLVGDCEMKSSFSIKGYRAPGGGMLCICCPLGGYCEEAGSFTRVL